MRIRSEYSITCGAGRGVQRYSCSSRRRMELKLYRDGGHIAGIEALKAEFETLAYL
jgi:hypothetical protein